MSNRYLRQITVVFACLITLAGCVGFMEKNKPAIVTGPTPVIDKHIFEKRKISLQNLLQTGNLDPSKRLMAQTLIDMYEKLCEGKYSEEKENLIKLLVRLDEAYFSHISPAPAPGESCISSFNTQVQEINKAFVSGNYDKVIDLTVQLKRSLGIDALSPQVALVFALALEKKGFMKEATEIGEDIIDQMEKNPTLFSLRSQLVMWHLRQGQKEMAMKNYDKLKLLLSHEQEVMAQLDTLVKSAKAISSPQESKLESVPVASIPIDQFLDQIDSLIDECEFDRARDMLAARKKGSSSDAEIEKIDQKIKELDTREEEFLKQRISALSKQKNSIQRAKKLVEQEKYELAINILNSVLRENPQNNDARRLKEICVEGIINRERNRAARLFLSARKTDDNAKKEQYLRESLKILEGLVDKYPLSPLINKVKSHILKVREELKKLG